MIKILIPLSHKSETVLARQGQPGCMYSAHCPLWHSSRRIQECRTQIDFSDMECTSGTMLLTAPYFLRVWDDIIAGFVISQQHTLLKLYDADVNITLEYKISNFFSFEELSWGSGSMCGGLSSIFTFSRCPHIYFAIQYKGECSQFKRSYMKLFDSLITSVKLQIYA